MKKESEAVLLRIFIGEDARYDGKHLYKYLVEFFKKEGLLLQDFQQIEIFMESNLEVFVPDKGLIKIINR